MANYVLERCVSFAENRCSDETTSRLLQKQTKAPPDHIHFFCRPFIWVTRQIRDNCTHWQFPRGCLMSQLFVIESYGFLARTRFIRDRSGEVSSGKGCKMNARKLNVINVNNESYERSAYSINLKNISEIFAPEALSKMQIFICQDPPILMNKFDISFWQIKH